MKIAVLYEETFLKVIDGWELGSDFGGEKWNETEHW